VQLADDSVSRFHTGLLHTPVGVWAINLLARGGTLVNGERVRWRLLQDCDELQVGKFVIRVHYGESDMESSTAPVTWNLPASIQSVSPRHVIPAQPLRRGIVDESLMLPVINQFNLMQQQMFDQFQQTMLMMVQMFTNMHREQMSLVRDELDQLHRVTQELRELQAELAARAPGSSGQNISQPSAVAPVHNSLNGKEARGARQAWSLKVPGENEPGPAAVDPSAKPGDEARQSTTHAPKDKPPPRNTDPNIHLWLSNRIAALQQERQGRLQRLFNIVRGK
jgi:hypothetical protein